MSGRGDVAGAPTAAPSGAPVPTLVALVAVLGSRVGGVARRGWASLRWLVTSMMGDTAYATYVEHHLRVHPDTPVPDERTFWRERFAEQDRTPGSRCC